MQLSRVQRSVQFADASTQPAPGAMVSTLHTHTDSKVVYRRYASLFFVCGIGQQDNELITLEIIHRCVQTAAMTIQSRL